MPRVRESGILLKVGVLGSGIRRLKRDMATLPQGKQQLSMLRDEVGRPR